MLLMQYSEEYEIECNKRREEDKDEQIRIQTLRAEQAEAKVEQAEAKAEQAKQEYEKKALMNDIVMIQQLKRNIAMATDNICNIFQSIDKQLIEYVCSKLEENVDLTPEDIYNMLNTKEEETKQAAETIKE